ncbi:hypothetical protein ECZU28_51150 [Escherichia coli]|nr:hypothetical protein ECZU28_51150 [Escherichia coli]
MFSKRMMPLVEQLMTPALSAGSSRRGAKRGGGNKYQNAEGKERTRRESHYGFQE